MKIRLLMFGLGVVLILFNACTKDSSVPGLTKVTLIAKSSDNIPTLKSATVSPAADSLVLLDFVVHVREIEFETEDEHMENMEDSLSSELEFEGSFLFDLIKNGTLGQQVVGDFDIPNNRYNEIEVNIYPYPDDGEDTLMQGKTVFIAGTYNGQLFEFWSDLMDNLEVEFPDSSAIELTGNDIDLYIDFHIDMIREGMLSYGFPEVVDGNGNGVIEINPENPDGNQELYWAITHLIKNSVDMDDDESNDNDESHGEDHS